jgi:hypothetical protein
MGCDSRGEAYEILQAVNEARKRFGKPLSRKYTGAATVEVLRDHLGRHGLVTSTRDVYIRGLPIEIDLLLPRPRAGAVHGILYEPQDVVFVLEVKASGSFGEQSQQAVRRTFERVWQAAGVGCGYVTIWERRGYKWAVTDESLGGFKAYTLFRHGGRPEELRPEHATGDWERLLSDLRSATGQRG